MTIGTITINTTDYDVYISVAEADIYLQADLKRASDWQELGTEEKGQAIITATRRLDRLNWQGDRSVSSQVLEWPRDISGLDENPPQELFDATAVLAADIFADNEVAETRDGETNVSSVKAGSVSVDFFTTKEGVILPKVAFELVGPWLESESSGAATFVSGVTGSLACSSFTDSNKYGRVNGVK